MTRRSAILFALFVLVLLIFPLHTEAQCAMCKQAAASSLDDPKSMARNLNTGILYLMAIPYFLIAFIFRKQIVALWRRWRGKEVADDVL